MKLLSLGVCRAQLHLLSSDDSGCCWWDRFRPCCLSFSEGWGNSTDTLMNFLKNSLAITSFQAKMNIKIFKALYDADNLPGVPGIGHKGALALIKEHGSLGSLLENASQAWLPSCFCSRTSLGCNQTHLCRYFNISWNSQVGKTVHWFSRTSVQSISVHCQELASLTHRC